MTIPVWVEQQNGTFTASVPGVPQLRATGDTRDEAVTALTRTLSEKQTGGELVYVTVPTPPASAVLDEPLTEEEKEATREMVAEIYRERDELKAAELAEYDDAELPRGRGRPRTRPEGAKKRLGPPPTRSSRD